jgi:hypothetical protein
MMYSFNTCHFVLYSLLSLSANAGTLQQGAQGELFEVNPSKVKLLSAGNYVILSKAGISTVPASVITGDIAVLPIAAAAITGFSLTTDSTNTFSMATQVTGQAFTANYAMPTPARLTSTDGIWRHGVCVHQRCRAP